MIAERSTTHVADTLALLTSAYKGRPLIEAIIRAFAKQTQKLEDSIWQAVDSVQIPETPATRTLFGDGESYFVGDEVSLPGEIGFFLRATVDGTSGAAPPEMTPGDPAYAPTPGGVVTDGGVTWVWFLSGNPYGFFLDALGEIAGEPRLARGDEEYLQAVRVKLRANRSLGRVQDILDVMTLLSTSIDSWAVDDTAVSMPRTIRVDAYGAAYPATIKRILGLTRAAGVRIEFAYSASPAADTLVWEDTVAGGAGSVWGDSVSSTGDVWASLEIAR